MPKLICAKYWRTNKITPQTARYDGPNNTAIKIELKNWIA